MFKGSFVALVTPFREGEIDEKKLRDLVEWQISEGTDGLVPVGTTGESTTLTHQEHSRVVEIVVETAKKRVPVIAGAGSNSTREAISLTSEAKELGADAVLSVNPYYNKPTQEGLKEHFGAIARAVDIPMILYNIPSRTNVNMSANTIAELARCHKNIIGIKEATGDMDQATEIFRKAGSSFLLFSGNDAGTLPLMSLGGKGVISVVANIVPKDMVNLCKLVESGKFDHAREAHQKLFPLIKAMFLETSPAPIKTAMKEVGLLEDDSLRLPLVNVQEKTREAIRSAIKDYGVLMPARVK